MLSRALSLLLLLSALLLSLPSVAQSDRLVIPLAELSDDDLAAIDLHDGYVDDWLRLVGGPTLTARDAYRWTGSSYWTDYDATDLDFRIWLAWHDATNRIFVAFERLDDQYENEFDGAHGRWRGVWMGEYDSSLTLWVDGDLQSDALYSLAWNGLPWQEYCSRATGPHQVYTGIAEVFDGGPHTAMDFGITDWMLHSPYSEGDGRRSGDNPIVTVLEFCFTPFDILLLDDPEGSRPTDLFPGKTIGLQIYLNDRDDGKLERYSFGAPVSEFDLGPMSHGYLVGKPQVDQGLDRFPEATWATVKHATAADSLAPQP